MTFAYGSRVQRDLRDLYGLRMLLYGSRAPLHIPTWAIEGKADCDHAQAASRCTC